jgi:hypothetical protein
MQMRHVVLKDFHIISLLLNEWWGGREMSARLPKLFLNILPERALSHS